MKSWLGLGLLTSGGERWFSHRRIITPTFHFTILEQFCDVFNEKSEILVNKLLPFAGTNKPVDVYPFVTRVALDIICETAMGIDIDAQNKIDHEYVRAIYE